MTDLATSIVDPGPAFSWFHQEEKPTILHFCFLGRVVGCGEYSVASGPSAINLVPEVPWRWQARKSRVPSEAMLKTDLRSSILMSLTSHGTSAWWRTRGRYLHVGRSSDLDQQWHVSFVITTPFRQLLQTVNLFCGQPGISSQKTPPQ